VIEAEVTQSAGEALGAIARGKKIIRYCLSPPSRG